MEGVKTVWAGSRVLRRLGCLALVVSLASCGGDGASESAREIEVAVLDTLMAPADAHALAYRPLGGAWHNVVPEEPGRYTVSLPPQAEAVEVAFLCDGQQGPRSAVYVYAFHVAEGRRILAAYCRQGDVERRDGPVSARLPAEAAILLATGSGTRATVVADVPDTRRVRVVLPDVRAGESDQEVVLLAAALPTEGIPEPLALAVLRDVDPGAAGAAPKVDLSDSALRLDRLVPLDLVGGPDEWHTRYRLHLLTAKGAKIVVQECVGVRGDLLAVPGPVPGGAAPGDWLELYAEARDGRGRAVYTRLHRAVDRAPVGFVMDFPEPFWPHDYRPRYDAGLVFEGLTDDAPGHVGYRFLVRRSGAAEQWELNVSDGFLGAAGQARYALPDLSGVEGFGGVWQPSGGEPIRFSAFSGSFERTDWQAYVLAPEPLGNRRHLPKDGQRLRVSRRDGRVEAAGGRP